MTAASAFCAICTDTIVGEVTREPLGRRGALVAVCAACNTTPPIARDDDRGRYEVPAHIAETNVLTRPRTSAAKMRSSMNRYTNFSPERIRAEQKTRNPKPLPKRPGFVLHRVRRVVGFTWDQAPDLIRHQPWAGEAHYLGITQQWVLFDRPDVSGATAERTYKPFNALAVLERYRMERDDD